MSSNPSPQPSATPRHGALIQPASIARLLDATRTWDALDQDCTQNHGALEAAISDARKDVSRRNLTAAPETPGLAAASPDAAITAILSARQRLACAAQSRVEVGAALHAAREAAERALTGAGDVLMARRAIAVAAAVLLALALLVMFNGRCARDAADAAARGVRDVAATLRERLSDAPRLTSVTAAQETIASGESAVTRADAELQAAVATIGGAIAAAAQQQALVASEQKTQRFDAPVDLLIRETFRDLPLHLAASFTKDYHRGFNYDQTSAWQNWKPSDPPVGLTSPGQPGFLMRWGSWQAKSELPLMFSALPLIGGGRPWVIVSGGDDASIESAHDLMRALALRIACTLPQQSRFTFLDPLGYGQTFPLQRYLPNVRETVVSHVATGKTLVIAGRIRKPEFMAGVSGDYLLVRGGDRPMWVFAANATALRD